MPPTILGVFGRLIHIPRQSRKPRAGENRSGKGFGWWPAGGRMKKAQMTERFSPIKARKGPKFRTSAARQSLRPHAPSRARTAVSQMFKEGELRLGSSRAKNLRG